MLAFSHGFVDSIKLYAQKESTRRLWFFIDQLLHFLFIGGTAFLCTKEIPPEFKVDDKYILLFATIAYALSQPASVAIQATISRWIPINANADSLQNVGNVIGMLERLLVFVFVVIGHWEVVGFLLAAKSVFRFGDLRQSDDRKLTEYVLNGTLLSFGVALLAGIVFSALSGL